MLNISRLVCLASLKLKYISSPISRFSSFLLLSLLSLSNSPLLSSPTCFLSSPLLPNSLFYMLLLFSLFHYASLSMFLSSYLPTYLLLASLFFSIHVSAACVSSFLCYSPLIGFPSYYFLIISPLVLLTCLLSSFANFFSPSSVGLSHTS